MISLSLQSCRQWSDVVSIRPVRVLIRAELSKERYEFAVAVVWILVSLSN